MWSSHVFKIVPNCLVTIVCIVLLHVTSGSFMISPSLSVSVPPPVSLPPGLRSVHKELSEEAWSPGE